LSRKTIVIAGAGGVARELRWLIREINLEADAFDLVGFVVSDEKWLPEGDGDAVLGDYSWLERHREKIDCMAVPTINFGGTMVLWAMAFESLIWPVMNVFANLYFIFIATAFGLIYFLAYWWLSLTILDLIAALYCVAVEREEARLIFYSLFYRLFFILIVDVCKTFATVEEFLGLGMVWGKLERIGAKAR
jgi:hypothetical protein